MGVSFGRRPSSCRNGYPDMISRASAHRYREPMTRHRLTGALTAALLALSLAACTGAAPAPVAYYESARAAVADIASIVAGRIAAS
jgi:hypothetical protein